MGCNNNLFGCGCNSGCFWIVIILILFLLCNKDLF